MLIETISRWVLVDFFKLMFKNLFLDFGITNHHGCTFRSLIGLLPFSAPKIFAKTRKGGQMDQNVLIYKF